MAESQLVDVDQNSVHDCCLFSVSVLFLEGPEGHEGKRKMA